MRPATIPTLACAVLFSAPALAQGTRPFPMDTAATDPALGTVTVLPNFEEFKDLMTRDHVTIADMYIPGGQLLDLQLERIDLDRLKYGFVVDGVRRDDLLDDLDITAWKGEVVGEENSQVFLSFSREGSRGWIQRGTDIVHLMPQPNAEGDWSGGSSVLVTEATLNALGDTLGGFCRYDEVSGTLGERTRTAPVLTQQDLEAQSMTQALGSCNFRECTIALETDYQLFQVFGSLGAETAYVTALTAAASDRYQTSVNTVLTFPYVQFYTNSNDPWSTPEGGGNSIDMLNELRNAWIGNIPANARIGHMLSGAGLGGGVAWLDILCNDEYNFSVSGNINGNTSFPITQNPNNWDFMVFTHELGHNFGSPHTHDYCPPLDECAPNGYFGQCQNSQVCTNQGTLMSYCHLCSGGLGNVTTFFHPQAIATMQPLVNSCLPVYTGAEVDPPTLISETTPTTVEATIVGNIQGNVSLNYRYNGGSYTTVTMTNTGGNDYSADLPTAACSDTPEFYISYTDSGCGPVNVPTGGASSPFTATVGTAATIFADNFNSNNGWTTQNLGASSGDWERGVPVDDGGWDYDPSSDGDGSGSAYLTQNQNGNTDVDGGAVRLFSPVLDMSGGNVVLKYRYFLRLTNTDGSDKLELELSPNGSSGPWTTIAVHDTDGGLSWRSHLVDMSATGVTLGNNMMIRVTANDADTQSIVEAGIDGFDLSSESCDDGGGSGPYCPGNANSAFPGGANLAHLSGTPGGVMDFLVTDLPNTPGLLFFGPNQQDQPFGCGRLCVGGPLVRSNVFIAGNNFVSATFDTTGTASNPFNIQYWYRDVANQGACGSNFNTSNAIGF